MISLRLCLDQFHETQVLPIVQKRKRNFWVVEMVVITFYLAQVKMNSCLRWSRSGKTWTMLITSLECFTRINHSKRGPTLLINRIAGCRVRTKEMSMKKDQALNGCQVQALSEINVIWKTNSVRSEIRMVEFATQVKFST